MEKDTIWQLLQADEQTGVSLVETYAMLPAASVCGLYFTHPEAKYFNLDKIAKDPVEDYSWRKGKSISEIERWLRQSLRYE